MTAAKKKEVVAKNTVPAVNKTDLVEVETKIQDEIMDLGENFSFSDIADAIGTLDYFVDHRTDECAEKGCDNLRTSQQFCRLHYVANWNDIKRKREILKEGKLQEYIEELIAKYPPSLIESIVGDLQDEKDFYKVLSDLNITSDMDYVDDDDNPDADDDDEDIQVETRSSGKSERYEDD